MDYTPEVPQHAAGLALYYDNMDYFTLEKHYSESLVAKALLVMALENGQRSQYGRTVVKPGTPLYLRLAIQGRKSWFEWSYDGESYEKNDPEYDTSKLSDEYCSYGEFTGTMVGIFSVDRLLRQHCADFDFFEYLTSPSPLGTSAAHT